MLQVWPALLALQSACVLIWRTLMTMSAFPDYCTLLGTDASINMIGRKVYEDF